MSTLIFWEYNIQANSRICTVVWKIEEKFQNRIPKELNTNFDILRIGIINLIIFIFNVDFQSRNEVSILSHY